MSAATQALPTENLILTINQEIEVKASLEDTFAALLEQLGTGLATPEGQTMEMKLEEWPGGRWYRDLGDGNGHLWGHVQSIKRPTLLEMTGPLFMSYAAVNNVQYRLTQVKGGTLISFHHYALGAIPDDVRENIHKGWTHINQRAREIAESKK